MSPDRVVPWWTKNRNRRLFGICAVLLMAIGVVFIISSFIHAYRLGYDGTAHGIPWAAAPYLRLGVVLVSLPGAVGIAVVAVAQWRYNHTH